MDTDQLQALRAAAEAGSLTEAARVLGLSQPGLSRRIQRLESQVGAPLLHRGGSGVSLTPSGQRVLAFAVRMLDEYEAVLAEVGGGPGALRGRLRIASSTTPGEYLVPDVLARFAQRHPRVAADVSVTDSSMVAGDLLARRRDVGFTGSRSGDNRLTEVPIARDEIVLAVPAGHRLSGRRRIEPAALRSERLVQREAGSGTQRVFAHALAARGMSLTVGHPTVTLGSTGAVLAAVGAGLGVGVVTLRAIEHHQPADVVAVRVTGVSVVRDLYLVYETERPRANHLQAFVDFVTADRLRPEQDRSAESVPPVPTSSGSSGPRPAKHAEEPG